MLQKSPQKDQSTLPVFAYRISYSPESALLQLESLKNIIQDSASAYVADIPALNEYLLEYHVQLIQNITWILQYHCMYYIAMTYISPDPSSFPTPLTYDIPSKGPN